MKRLFAILLFVVAINSIYAQDKMLSVDEAVMKGRTALAPERLSQLQWIPATHKFCSLVKIQGKEFWVITDADGMKKDTVLGIDEFNAAWLNVAPGEKMMNKFPLITWTSPITFRFTQNNIVYLFNFSNKAIRILARAPKTAEDLDFDAVSNKLSYSLGDNLYVNDAGKINETQEQNDAGNLNQKADIITTDGGRGMVYGKSVHRNEFGITKGTFFSPKGNKLAFYKMNEAMVTDYSLMNVTLNDTQSTQLSKPTTTEAIKYPMAGNRSHHVKVMLYDFKKKRMVEINTSGDPEQYHTNISWSPDEEYIYIALLNRDQNEMKLQMFDGTTGQFIRTLFTETHPKYVEPEKPMYFLKTDNTKFIWFSEKDGYNHLYLYNVKGDMLKQLTKGKFVVTDIISMDEKGAWLYYHATSTDGMSKYVCRLDLKSGVSTTINKLEGQHTGMVTDDGMYVIDHLSAHDIPRRYTLMDSKGKDVAILFNAANPIREYKACKIKLFSIPSTDKSVSLNCRMILPADFDSTKKYPVIVYVYGGPHAQMITNTWLGGADLWLYYMAQQGYITFTLDNRGSMNRGLEFENATFRQLGKLEIEDQLAGVSYLKGLSYVNPARLGVYGWSFGGFMSTSLMTKTPDVFKVGVAGGPVIDWRMYEIMYTERYMDMPQNNPEGYRNADLTNYTKNLKGKLLLIHGVNDNVVLWQHTLTYLKKSVDEGVLVDYMVYPGHEHNVLGPDRVHLMKKITQYFKDFL